MNARTTLLESPGPRSELGVLLRFLRKRVDPDALSLGPHVRLRARIGKRVTQEELAEAVGVSREWYAVLESAASPTRTSPGLLDRLASALMATPEERARLFELAVSEVGRSGLRNDSLAVLEAFSRLRALSKRLWAVTSVEEALTMASEHIAEWFESSAAAVHPSRRHEPGVWEYYDVDGIQGWSHQRNVIGQVQHAFSTSEEIDALNLYPQLWNAGETGTADLHPVSVARERGRLLSRSGLSALTFLKARVRSRNGVIGAFCITHASGYSYSQSDRAVLGAFAELASLALS